MCRGCVCLFFRVWVESVSMESKDLLMRPVTVGNEMF